MRYLFFGTPKFSAVVLKKLIEAGIPPSGVVSNPDRPSGRKKIITPPPAKVLALEHDILVYQPESLKDLDSKGVDFAVVAAYAKIIPQEVINAFPGGIIGVHPSLLPKYRGASPIQSAIMNGDKETGITLYQMDEKIDHGDILAASVLQMANSGITYGELEEKLADVAGDLLVKILPELYPPSGRGGIKPIAQNESQATFTKKFSTQDGFVDLDKDDPVIIDRKVRALNPEPGAWTVKNNKRMKILKAELDSSAGGNKLKLKEIQYEGGKPQILPI